MILDEASIYRETAENRCDFGEIFTTDGRLLALQLTLVEDPGVFLVYNVSMSVRDEIYQQYPQLEQLAASILGPLTDRLMSELNGQVAVLRRPPEDVARRYLVDQGFLAAAEAPDIELQAVGEEGPTELEPSVPEGASNIIVSLQEDLRQLGFYEGPTSGSYDEAATEAVRQFQEEVGLAVDGLCGPQNAAAIDVARGRAQGQSIWALQEALTILGYYAGVSEARGTQSRRGRRTGDFRPPPGPTGSGSRGWAAGAADRGHIVRQLAFLVLSEDSITTINVSTGSGDEYTDAGGSRALAYTPTGDFVIERRIDGIRRAPLGSLYRPLYFHRGWAIHGSANVPAYPASHGCFRSHNWDQDWLVQVVSDGTPVIIYDDLRDADAVEPDDAEAGF